MELSTLLSFFLSFLGGGLVAATLNWIRVARSESRALRANRVRQQLDKLYGPLFFVTSQANKILEISRRHSEGFRIEYIESKSGASDEVMAAIDVDNEYAKELHNLAKEASVIMRGAYSYIDPEDVGVFQDVVIDALRLTIEREDCGKMKTPLEIYEHVGEMHFFRESFIMLIEQRFIEMRKELVSFEV
jgi:hypothetical protein